jgi:hypothetical protein
LTHLGILCAAVRYFLIFSPFVAGSAPVVRAFAISARLMPARVNCLGMALVSGWFEEHGKNPLPPVMAQSDQYVAEP